MYSDTRFSRSGLKSHRHIQMSKSSEFRRGLSIAFRLGTELTVAVMIGAVMGYALDYYFDTRPWFLAIGVVMGGAAGCLNVYRVSKNITVDEDKEKNNDV